MECNGQCVDCGASVTRDVPDDEVLALAEALSAGDASKGVDEAARFLAGKCDACQEAAERKAATMAKRFSLSSLATGIPQEVVLGDDPEQGNAQLREFIRLNGAQRSLWIGDAPKIGKTRSLCVEGYALAARERVNLRYCLCPVEFEAMTQAVFEKCGDSARQAAKSMAKAEILILDDVDKMPLSHAALSMLHDIMTERAHGHKITWAASNQPGQWIEENFGQSFGKPLRWRLTQDAAVWEDYLKSLGQESGQEDSEEEGEPSLEMDVGGW